MFIKKLKYKFESGFTLVELLIVIALLAAIALIVIAAINPVEQANRARDTRLNSDAGQVISAVERYFATTDEFPWVTGSLTANNEAALTFRTAGTPNLGICGASCTADGSLITGQELKTEFRDRDFVTATATEDQILVGKDAGAAATTYACYIPFATSTRQRSCADGNVYTVSGSTRTPVATSTCSSASADWTSSNWRVCLPQ